MTHEDDDAALASLRETLSLLQQQVGQDAGSFPTRLVDALTTAVEELSVTLEELHRQNDELQEVHARLRYERRRYVDLFRQAPESYLVTTTTGVVQQANAAACRLFGVARGQLQGQQLLRFLRREARPAFSRFLRTAANGLASTELVVTPRNHVPVMVSVTVVPAPPGPGRAAELRWILRDVTDARRAQASLQAAFARRSQEADELRERDRWKDAFLAAAAHDLHAPLSLISATARTLVATQELGDAEPEVRTIEAQARRVTRLLDDLLDLDRFTRGTVSPERRPADLVRLVEDAVADAILDGGDVEIDVPPIEVNLDPGRTGQIITNLVMNAGMHTPAGTPIRVVARAVEGGVDIVVEDDGPGIPSALREEVFRPFVTRPAHADDDLGTGLGLSLVRLFAELQQGRAEVQESPRGGTRVVVHLPTHVEA